MISTRLPFVALVAASIVSVCAAIAPEALARGGRSSGGSVRVRGYTRKDGTWVPPHHRSAPDGRFSNNWSTAGNVNPYTGELGTLTTPPGSGGSGTWSSGGYDLAGSGRGPATATTSSPSVSLVPSVLYDASELDAPTFALESGRAARPTHVKVGRSGRAYYHVHDGPLEFWVAELGGQWVATPGALGDDAATLRVRMYAVLESIDWPAAARIASAEARFGELLRIVEEHAAECGSDLVAETRRIVSERWQARVEAARAVWSAGDHAGAYAQATALAAEYAGSSLGARTADWARVIGGAISPSLGASERRSP